MEENGTLHYYLQDEMGSPIRVSSYDSTDAYRTYGYDEFGNDLAETIGRELEEAGIPSPYTRQGEGQPFGYTGYRYDTLGATYFAQAREYDPQTGRFCAQDVIAGNGAAPVTLNRYTYCLGNPMGLVDLNGLTPAWLDGIRAHIQFETEFLVLYYEEIGLCATDELYGDINIYIKGSGQHGGMGFADMILYNQGISYVYEIKPISYYNDIDKRQEGENQLQRYIDTIIRNGGTAVRGQMEDIEMLLFFWSAAFCI